MKDDLIKANINLFAILRNLEDLCELDSEIKALANNKNLSIQFTVRNGPEGLISLNNGKCKLQRGTGRSNIKLYFKSPKHFNKMIDGRANPIILKGFTKIGFLKNEFIKMTDRLSHYLKPTESLLKDPSYFKINTILTAYTAFFALAEIAELDKIGKLNVKRIPDGIISISVLNSDLSIYLTVEKGHIKVSKENSGYPRAAMIFEDIETVNLVLNDEIDTYTCIASEKLQMKGFIPMLDNMNKLLGQVPYYIK